ncbi:MAG: type IV pilus assembly protein PilM [Candidatus Pacebacteria bacterium]|nr:type IV pilus assembly protein PilM [Candidatus Paceibacterota bacterium]MDD2757258.1 type IV pilus assembly protein PilM [Candidatus Paceibacterota bacterium]MDD3283754.1 type IV pilus assembly protein PilM [Candidatus Paceibacterota bacterium]MDD3969856.1 type IV pilus assembly protein PilM [Candidatus Paceibacterota bacterium]MDD4738016.1 type IV pilus assembly protein PilM [Candidatus Paceibacterota bacterium]
MSFFSKKKKSGIGIDIGSKVIKVVELSKRKNEIILSNYGEVNLDFACSNLFRSFENKNLNPQVDNISLAIKELIKETGIHKKSVIFSLPDFSTFFSTFQMPPMTKKEIDSAVYFEARKYIPLPLDEIFLDWQSVDNKISEKEVNRILVMAISKRIIEDYKKIAIDSGLELIAVEPEAVSLKRAIHDGFEGARCLVEIGFQSTNISIVDNNQMKMSFSFDISGKDITNSIAGKLNIGYEDAEEMKRKHGLGEGGDPSLRDSISSIISEIARNVRNIINDFEKKENILIENILLFGGTSLMSGILDYFDEAINFRRENRIQIEMGKPFDKIVYPREIEENMKEINANYSIALGEALKFFE